MFDVFNWHFRVNGQLLNTLAQMERVAERLEHQC